MNAAHRRKILQHKRSLLKDPCQGSETCLEEGFFWCPGGRMCVEHIEHFKGKVWEQALDLARRLDPARASFMLRKDAVKILRDYRERGGELGEDLVWLID